MTNYILYILIISLIIIPVSISFIINPGENRLLDISIAYMTTPLIALLIYLNLKKNNVVIRRQKIMTKPVYVRYDMQAIQYLDDNELRSYNVKTKESYAIITG